MVRQIQGDENVFGRIQIHELDALWEIIRSHTYLDGPSPGARRADLKTHASLDVGTRPKLDFLQSVSEGETGIIRLQQCQRGTALIEPAHLHTTPVGLTVDPMLHLIAAPERQHVVQLPVDVGGGVVDVDQLYLFLRAEIGNLKVPVGGLQDVAYPAGSIAQAKSPRMKGAVKSGLMAVKDSLVYRLAVVVANRDLLRLKDDGRQEKAYRNEKAIEFQ